jgi:phosphoribosyl-dephospho-CoA transferase
LLWQHVTGQAYVTPESDLDLLWPVADSVQAERLVRGVQGIAEAAPMRLDGELLLPGGQGVNWRECLHAFAQPDKAVIAKSMAGLSVVSIHKLFCAFGHAA